MPEPNPHAHDLAVGRHAVMAEAFEVLADHLGPFIDQRMADYFHDEPSWAEAAANRLGRPTEHGATDPLFQLLVLRRFWGPVFADFYGQDLRQIVSQLIETRNKWAHFSFPDEPQALQRAVLAIERLLAPVEPAVTGRLRRLRAEVYNPDQSVDVTDGRLDTVADLTDGTNNVDAGTDIDAVTDIDAGTVEQTPHGGPTIITDGPLRPMKPPPGVGKPVDRRKASPRRRRDEVDVTSLRAQLLETEVVFQELQTRYGDLEAELSNSRRITESKQLRLSRIERQLVEAEDHSNAIAEDLIEERITRQHIEWLIVSLLATLLLFMVLAST